MSILTNEANAIVRKYEKKKEVLLPAPVGMDCRLPITQLSGAILQHAEINLRTRVSVKEPAFLSDVWHTIYRQALTVLIALLDSLREHLQGKFSLPYPTVA